MSALNPNGVVDKMRVGHGPEVAAKQERAKDCAVSSESAVGAT
jgi:hypothetical protein